MINLPPHPSSSPSTSPSSSPPLPRPASAVSLLVDATLSLLSADPEALELMQGHAGLITLTHGRLRMPQQQAALEAAAAELAAGIGPTCRGLALHRGSEAPLTIRLDRAPETGPLRLWLHIVDAATQQLDGKLLGTMFGLTFSEQRVALLLAQGWSADDIAAHLGVQGNTVRSHIKQLLVKTHTHRQAQLVSWLWRSAAVVLTPAVSASRPAPSIPAHQAPEEMPLPGRLAHTPRCHGLVRPTSL